MSGVNVRRRGMGSPELLFLQTQPGLPGHAALARRLLEDVQRDGGSSARRRLMLVPVSGETSPLPTEVSPAMPHPRSEHPSGYTHPELWIIEGASRTQQRASGASEEKSGHAHGRCRGAAEASGGVRDAPGPWRRSRSPRTRFPRLRFGLACMSRVGRSAGGCLHQPPIEFLVRYGHLISCMAGERESMSMPAAARGKLHVVEQRADPVSQIR